MRAVRFSVLVMVSLCESACIFGCCLQNMPKIYNLGPGLSNRVHRALLNRVARFMANAESSGHAEEGVPGLPMTENPPVAPGVISNEGEAGKQDGEESQHPPPGETQKTPTERGDEDGRDRSRSPRLLRSPEADLDDTKGLLSATMGLSTSITTLVASLKGVVTRMDTVLEQTQKGHADLTRSMEIVGKAIQGMSHSIESLSGSVSYHASRTGAMVGEVTKLRKHLEWCMNVDMKATLESNQEGRQSRNASQQDLMNQLCEAMDLLQNNIRGVAEKFEKACTHEEKAEYDPPCAPTGEVSTTAPMTPGFIPCGAPVPPPPPTIPLPSSGVPVKSHGGPQEYKPPTLPLARFAGFSPARMGEAPMVKALPLPVNGMKTACHMQDEVSGKIFSASPTARHSPSTGTAAFAPLGYIRMAETGEFRRVYPQ